MTLNRTLLSPPEWKEWIDRHVCATEYEPSGGYTYEHALRDMRYRECHEIALYAYSKGLCVHPEQVNQHMSSFKLWRAGVIDEGLLIKQAKVHRHGEYEKGKEG